MFACRGILQKIVVVDAGWAPIFPNVVVDPCSAQGHRRLLVFMRFSAADQSIKVWWQESKLANRIQKSTHKIRCVMIKLLLHLFSHAFMVESCSTGYQICRTKFCFMILFLRTKQRFPSVNVVVVILFFPISGKICTQVERDGIAKSGAPNFQKLTDKIREAPHKARQLRHRLLFMRFSAGDQGLVARKNLAKRIPNLTHTIRCVMIKLLLRC